MQTTLIDCCQYFDGVNNIIQLGHQSLFRHSKSQDEFTVSLWVYCMNDWLESNEKQRTLFYKGNKDKFVKVYLATHSNHVVFESNDWMVSSTEEITLYSWVHVVVSCSSSSGTVELYVNGEQIGRDNVVVSVNLFPLYIGSDHERKNCFVGCMQSLHLFNKRQSVLELYSPKPEYPLSVFKPAMRIESKPFVSMKQLDSWRPGLDPVNISTVPFCSRPIEAKRKVLHCHDMSGGYLADALSQGGTEFCIYNFHYWQYLDYFIYFSHHRVTIPPPGWIEAAHRNGVKCLGTFITEWELGEKEIIILLDGPGKHETVPDDFSRYYADKLIDIAEYYKFDGWFFNIENKLPDTAYVRKMINFIDYMTKEMHRRLPGSIVMWYDSVTIQGELKWQNALNEKNKPFFDVCDAIFLNYCWNPTLLQSSVDIAGDRVHDIFTGIDIFGRNTYGGGGFTSHIALQEIQQCGTSTALFAPGWTFETSITANASSEALRLKFEANEAKFWTGLNYQQLLKNASGNFGLEDWDIIENGGNGWKIEDGGFSGKCFVTSYAFCKKRQVIDLTEHECFVNGPLPLTIHCGVWYQGKEPNYEDKFYLKLELRDEDQNVVKSFDSGMLTCSESWQFVSHAFNFSSDSKRGNVRYLVWEDGGKDVEYWAGHYGCKISGAYVEVEQPKSGSISQYCPELPVPFVNNRFITNFNTGVGKKYWIQGREVLTSYWNNMRDQSILPTFYNRTLSFPESAKVHFSVCYDDSYNGGSCAKFTAKEMGRNKLGLFELFKTDFTIQSDCVVSLVTKTSNKSSRCHFVLYENEGTTVISDNLIPVTLPDAPNIRQHSVNCLVEQKHNGWQVVQMNLSQLSGTQVNQIGICCESIADGPYEMLLGQIIISTGDAVLADELISDGTFTLTWHPSSLEDASCDPICHVNLEWQKCTDNSLTYHVFKDGTFIGKSFSTCYRVDSVTNLKGKQTVFTIVPVLETLSEPLVDKCIEIVVTG